MITVGSGSDEGSCSGFSVGSDSDVFSCSSSSVKGWNRRILQITIENENYSAGRDDKEKFGLVWSRLFSLM